MPNIEHAYFHDEVKPYSIHFYLACYNGNKVYVNTRHAKYDFMHDHIYEFYNEATKELFSCGEYNIYTFKHAFYVEDLFINI
jgi:hypothetical protein